MFTRTFLQATAERAVRAFAAAVLSLWAVGDGLLNALNVDWTEAAGIGAGAALVSVLLSIVGSAGSTPGPALLGAETTAPPAHPVG